MLEIGEEIGLVRLINSYIIVIPNFYNQFPLFFFSETDLTTNDSKIIIKMIIGDTNAVTKCEKINKKFFFFFPC